MSKILLRSLILAAITITLLTLTQPRQAKETLAQSRFAKLDTMRVHYHNYGEGKDALVFVHGWSCNIDFWKPNLPAFVNHSRVIAIDLPGHGKSDKPQTTYSMDLFARAIDVVLQDAGVERVTLVGHSMGTPVIRQFYRKYPNKTRALVIVDGGLRPFADKAVMNKFIEGFRGPDYKQFAEQVIGSISDKVKNPADLATIKDSMMSTPQHVMVSAMESMADPEIWKTQDKINVPTLAIMAKNEQAWTPDYEKFVRELVPILDYQVWDGVSHFLMMDEPQKFNETVMIFLRKNKLVKQ
jgi:pimeloyl-ACP methyl ester carboxylesterase